MGKTNLKFKTGFNEQRYELVVDFHLVTLTTTLKPPEKFTAFIKEMVVKLCTKSWGV